ncbi:MAG TPA: hypothetical protein PLD20_01235 [Blastocatellia bacterium]|nr:hypothetical protein [Blastocatellia bacterium]HMY72871.1 hypothetical protein [Blastocatellia bacterium]HMZ16559.1 hypothetical protein [Blastocatellia bacterium]HNG31641.1 hypothetical protein [Blastocatellia bacterium]
MRKDMSKVVVERPRYGHKDLSKKTKLRINRYDPGNEYDDLPNRLTASMSRRTKGFTDVLGPLKKFLQSNVGQPWDKVYSELCEHLDRRKTTGRHVFQHLEDYIETKCFVGEDGEIYACEDRGGIQPVNDSHRWRARFYVHPKTGLLCKRKTGVSLAEREEKKRQQRKTAERRPISVNQSYIRINGVWYIGDYVPDEANQRFDQKAEDLKLRYWDGKRWMQLVSKRKCTQKEVQKGGLNAA